MPQESTGILERLIQERLKLTSARLARNTEIGYRSAWKMFETWCSQMGREPLPADSESVSLYITDMIACNGKKVSTLLHRCAAIGHRHVKAGFHNPVSKEVRSLLSAAKRVRLDQVKQMRPLELEQLRKMAEVLTSDNRAQSTRDRAILVTGFASGLRAASLVELLIDDIEFLPQGVLVRVRKEKQDQEGKGRYLGLPEGKYAATCPIRAIKAWLEIRGGKPGALFTKIKSQTMNPMRPGTLLVIVKRSLKRIDVDPTNYGAHSLRAGFVTTAGENGAAELLIARQTGHRSLEVLRRYFRSRDAFKGNAAGALGL